jgi:hypothetical protein
MIAYNSNWLNNLQVQLQLDEAMAANCISKEEQAAGIDQYPVGFYTPNIFIRTGLFILTVVIAFFSIGLLALVMLGNNGEKTFGILLLIFSLASYVTLELMAREKHHYKSGADDALVWITCTSILSGINLLADVSTTANAAIVLVLALYFLIRFGYALMGALVPLAFLAIVFLNVGNSGNFVKAIAPFLILLLSAGIYFIAQNLIKQHAFRLYKMPLNFMKITALICLYMGVNYYTVREASIIMMHKELAEGTDIPLAWLFWIFTVCIPLLYIYLGIQKKDVTFLRVGLALVAAVVFTVRYYYSVAPVEVAMTVGGAILVTLAYLLIRYLHQPKHGFTSEEIEDKAMTGKLAIEALIVAETFSATQPADNPTNYGGGSFGGGGASGDF